MKFLALALIAAVAVSPSAAFTAGIAKINRSNRDPSLSARVDSSELVKEAMKITEKFGSTSVEARLAWETVEEIDASDNSAASAGNLNDECEVDAEVIPQECLDYGEALEELQALMASTAPVSSVGGKSVEPVKIPGPRGVAAPQSKELQAALKEARAVTSKKGLASPEASAAWLAVEEIAASGTTNAVGPVLSDGECFAEEAAQEACAALEELSKLIVGTASVEDKLVAMMDSTKGEATMRALWKELDTNYDNRVSGKEWGSKVYAKQDIMSEYFGGSTLKEIGEAFNRIDRNGDDSLTYDEFKAEIATYKATKLDHSRIVA